MNTTAIILSIVSGLISIAVTYFTMKLNPKQKLLDAFDKNLRLKIAMEKTRDEALAKNDVDQLTLSGNALIKLHNDQADILQRLANLGTRR